MKSYLYSTSWIKFHSRLYVDILEVALANREVDRRFSPVVKNYCAFIVLILALAVSLMSSPASTLY